MGNFLCQWPGLIALMIRIFQFSFGVTTIDMFTLGRKTYYSFYCKSNQNFLKIFLT